MWCNDFHIKKERDFKEGDFMESNQDGLKALLQEKDCVGVPANEEYQEYRVDYLLDENFF